MRKQAQIYWYTQTQNIQFNAIYCNLRKYTLNINTTHMIQQNFCYHRQSQQVNSLKFSYGQTLISYILIAENFKFLS